MFTFNFKRLPKGLLLGLSMILVFETGNFLFDDFFCQHSFDDLRIKINNKFSQNPKNDFDVLVLGDCYNVIGLIPKVIEEETGLICYNFAVYECQTVLASYSMLKNYLKYCSKKPKYIVIGYIIASCSLTKEFIESDYISYLYTLKEGNMGSFIREFGIARSINFLIPSMKHQWFFKRLFMDPSSLDVPGKSQIDDFIRQIYADKGHYAWGAFEDVYDLEAKEGTIWDTRFRLSPFFKKYIIAILDLARQNNIELIYLIPSSTPDWYRLYKRSGDIERYSEFCDWIRGKYPDTAVLDPQRILNKKDMYGSPRHLNRKGALLLSEFLSEALNSQKR